MSDFTNTLRAFSPLSSFRASGLIAAFAFLICLFAAQSAQAQLTLTVTRTDDRNTVCVSGVDCSLREAVNAANAAATNDTINFAIPAGNAGCISGVCTITLTLGDLAVNDVATAGTLTITNSTGASNLLISGNSRSRVFYINPAANLTISGVTITKGTGIGTISPGLIGFGGGILNNGGTLTLTSSTVSGNTAGFDGGGITNIGTLTLTNSTVSGNSSAESGGGIRNFGTLTLTNSIVSSNTAQRSGGGISNGGTTTLTNSTVSGNTTSESGGGISTGGTTTLTNSTVSGNMARNNGGGIFHSGTLNLTSSTVSGNAAGSGGGIYNISGTSTLTNSTISGNTAGSGGGIYITGGGIYPATTTLINSTVSGNTASFSGSGGIFNSGGTLNLTSVTVTGNKLTNATCTICAGGIQNDGTANLKNTIVAGNTAVNSASSPDFGGAVAAGSSYNLIGNGQGTTGITNGDANSNQVGVDPLLDPTLQLNGGTTENHALLAGSPAIDKGNSFGLTTDQRGLTRPVDLATYPNAAGGDGADIGAFEVQAPTAASVSVGGRVMTASGRGIRNVRLTLTDSNGESRTATTTAFGYYRFADVQAGETYILSAVGKRFSFSQPTRVLNINGEIDAINFIADSGKSIKVF